MVRKKHWPKTNGGLLEGQEKKRKRRATGRQQKQQKQHGTVTATPTPPGWTGFLKTKTKLGPCGKENTRNSEPAEEEGEQGLGVDKDRPKTLTLRGKRSNPGQQLLKKRGRKNPDGGGDKASRKKKRGREKNMPRKQ